jgi:hypothetical protein
MDQFNGFIGFAGVGGAIIASMGLAMWMEWYCLRLLMRLMPGRMKAMQATSTMNAAEEELDSAGVTLEGEMLKRDPSGARESV